MLVLPQSTRNCLDILDRGRLERLGLHIGRVVAKAVAVLGLGSDNANTVLLDWVESKRMAFSVTSRGTHPCHLRSPLCGGPHGSWDSLIIASFSDRIEGIRHSGDVSLYPGGLGSLLGDGLGSSIEHDDVDCVDSERFVFCEKGES